MSRTPTVSIVMPAYNAHRFIDGAIRSIRDQTLADWELIIVNDGSSDDTGALAERHAADDRRIRVIHQENAGQAVANNRAIPEARAGYIARMDADDVSLPERLSALSAFLDTNPHVVVVGTNAIVCDPAGEERQRTQLPESDDAIRNMLLTRRTNPFFNPTLMFRKNAWLACGGERPCFRHAHDLDLSLRLIAHGAARNLPTAGVRYRIHDAQDSAVATESQAVCALAAFICSDARNRGFPEPEFTSQNETIDRQALRRARVADYVIDDAIISNFVAIHERLCGLRNLEAARTIRLRTATAYAHGDVSARHAAAQCVMLFNEGIASASLRERVASWAQGVRFLPAAYPWLRRRLRVLN